MDDPDALFDAIIADAPKGAAPPAAGDPDALFDAIIKAKPAAQQAAPAPPKSPTAQKLEAWTEEYYKDGDRKWGRTSPNYIAERVPVVSAALGIDYYKGLYDSVKRFEGGKETDDDIARVASYLAKQKYEEGKSFGGGIVDQVTHFPGVIAEFAMTGGALPAAKKAAEHGVKAFVKNLIGRNLIRAAIMPSTYGAAAARTVAPGEGNESGLATQSVPVAAAKAYGTAALTNTALEGSGAFAGKVASAGLKGWAKDTAASTGRAVAAIDASKEVIKRVLSEGEGSEAWNIISPRYTPEEVQARAQKDGIDPKKAEALVANEKRMGAAKRLAQEGIAFGVLEGVMHAGPSLTASRAAMRRKGMNPDSPRELEAQVEEAAKLAPPPTGTNPAAPAAPGSPPEVPRPAQAPAAVQPPEAARTAPQAPQPGAVPPGLAERFPQHFGPPPGEAAPQGIPADLIPKFKPTTQPVLLPPELRQEAQGKFEALREQGIPEETAVDMVRRTAPIFEHWDPVKSEAKPAEPVKADPLADMPEAGLRTLAGRAGLKADGTVNQVKARLRKSPAAMKAAERADALIAGAEQAKPEGSKRLDLESSPEMRQEFGLEQPRAVAEPERPLPAPRGWEASGDSPVAEPADVPAAKQGLPKGMHVHPAQDRVAGMATGWVLNDGGEHWRAYPEPMAAPERMGLDKAVAREALPMPPFQAEAGPMVRRAWDVVSRLWPEMAGEVKGIRVVDFGGRKVRASINDRGILIVPKGGGEVRPDSLWHEFVHLEQRGREGAKGPLERADHEHFEVEREAYARAAQMTHSKAFEQLEARLAQRPAERPQEAPPAAAPAPEAPRPLSFAERQRQRQLGMKPVAAPKSPLPVPEPPRKLAPMEQIKARRDAGEHVEMQDVFEAAELTGPEQFVMRERLNNPDATHEQIGQRWYEIDRKGKRGGKGTVGREMVRKTEAAARAKLGMAESVDTLNQTEKAGLKGEATKARDVEWKEKEPGKRQTTSPDSIEEAAERLNDWLVQDAEAGRMTAELQAKYNEEGARIARGEAPSDSPPGMRARPQGVAPEEWARRVKAERAHHGLFRELREAGGDIEGFRADDLHEHYRAVKSEDKRENDRVVKVVKEARESYQSIRSLQTPRKQAEMPAALDGNGLRGYEELTGIPGADEIVNTMRRELWPDKSRAYAEKDAFDLLRKPPKAMTERQAYEDALGEMKRHAKTARELKKAEQDAEQQRKRSGHKASDPGEAGRTEAPDHGGARRGVEGDPREAGLDAGGRGERVGGRGDAYEPTAAELAAQRADVAESQAQEGVMFSRVPTGARVHRVRPDRIPAAVKADDPAVEARLQKAHGVDAPTLFDYVKQAAADAWRKLTRAQPNLPNNAKFATANEGFRLLKSVPDTASDQVNRALAAIVDPLGPQQLALLERALIVENQLAGLERGQPLRFGFKDKAAVQAYKAKVDKLVAGTPEVQQALKTREAIRAETVKEAVDLGILGKEALDNAAYYHQMVASMMDNVRYSGGARPLRVQRSFQKARVAGESLPEQFDYNSSYLEAEARWMTELKMEVAKEKLLREHVGHYDILDQLTTDAYRKRMEAQGADFSKWTPEQIAEAAKVQGGDWRKELRNHPDYEVWSPEPGNLFYRAHTVPEHVAEQIAKGMIGEAGVNPADVREALVVGGLRRPMVLPKELVAQLQDTLSVKPEKGIAALARDAMGGWKLWTILNPRRALGYMARNLTGDVDPLVGAAPGAAKDAIDLIGPLREYYRGKLSMTPELKEMRDLGVISSSMTARDIPEVKDLPVLRRLYDTPTKASYMIELPARYFEAVRGFNEFRESIARAGAYRYYKRKLDSGEQFHYGGAKKEVVDALAKEKGNAVAAAHLSRQLLGDYGNLTEAGSGMRRYIAPFWSWVEVNFKRWPRLAENAVRDAAETGSVKGIARLTGVAAAKGGAALAVNAMKLGAVYAATYAWNNTVMADEEGDLSPEQRASPHITLGRNGDGSVRYFGRVGALGDFLEWFGIPKLLENAESLQAGQTTVAEVAGEMAKAPVNKAIQAMRPDAKALGEAVTGISTFPDAFNLRPTPRDEVVPRALGLDELYKLGKRQAGSGDSIKPGAGQRFLGVSAADPGQEAVNEMHDLRDKFLRRQGKKVATGFGPSAIAKMRNAASAGDVKAFNDAKKNYLGQGGNVEKLRESLDRLDPVSGRLSAADAQKFQQFLTEPQKKKLVVARQHAKQLRVKIVELWRSQPAP